MNFRDYEEAAARTAGEHEDGVLALANWSMGLAGETGELVDYLKKMLFHGMTGTSDEFIKEAGDVLWYLALICRDMHVSLEEVAERNIKKLKARYPEGFESGGGER